MKFCLFCLYSKLSHKSSQSLYNLDKLHAMTLFDIEMLYNIQNY